MFTTAVPLPPVIVAALSVPAVVPLPRFSVPVVPEVLAKLTKPPPTETVPFPLRFSVPLPALPMVRLPELAHVPPLIFTAPLLPMPLPTEPFVFETVPLVIVRLPVPSNPT